MVVMKITKQVREYISLAVKELEDMGIRWEIEIDKRHSRLIYYVNGRTIVTGIGNSPSDRRAALNLRSQVRNTVKQAEAR